VSAAKAQVSSARWNSLHCGYRPTSKTSCPNLTYSDYSTDLVRSCFLGTTALVAAVVDVAPLTDDEDDELGRSRGYPFVALHSPADTALGQILRNPYCWIKPGEFLGPAHRPLPESERDFRPLFWQEMVRADQRAANGQLAGLFRGRRAKRTECSRIPCRSWSRFSCREPRSCRRKPFLSIRRYPPAVRFLGH